MVSGYASHLLLQHLPMSHRLSTSATPVTVLSTPRWLSQVSIPKVAIPGRVKSVMVNASHDQWLCQPWPASMPVTVSGYALRPLGWLRP
eukprot:SAG31_NODE_21345_length_552_cov_0.613687_1_plen_88_part_10